MKIFISLVLGLTFGTVQFAQASALDGAKLDCTDQGDDFLGATLIESPQYGIIALLADGYNTTQLTQPAPNGTFWMICHSDGPDLVCPGRWSIGSVPTEARFSRGATGTISVTFTRDNHNPGQSVTIACLPSKN